MAPKDPDAQVLLLSTEHPTEMEWNDVIQIGIGLDFTTAVIAPSRSGAKTGQVYCWGRDDYGQCGNAPAKQLCPDRTQRCLMTREFVPDVPISRAVYSGALHSCAISTDEQIACWGQNDVGQSRPDTACGASRCAEPHPCCIEPGIVPGANDTAKPITRLALGAAHSCALIEEQVRCWGVSSRLGDELALNDQGPVTVKREDGTPLTGVLDIAAGGSLSCAMTRDDQVYCWGLFGDSLFRRAQLMPW